MAEWAPSSRSRERLASFCDEWGVVELAVFGSAVRGELGPDSDLDFLISFEPGRTFSLLDLAEMEMELETIFDREVELVTRSSVETSENVIRRTNILESAQRIIHRLPRESGSGSA